MSNHITGDPAITAKDFLEQYGGYFGREIDDNSTFFFGSHPISVNLIHRILTGQVQTKGDQETDLLVVNALMLEMFGLWESTTAQLEKIEKAETVYDQYETVLAGFSRRFPDAGKLIERAVEIYFKVNQ